MGAWGTGIYHNDQALDFVGKITDHAFKTADFDEDFLVVANMLQGQASATKVQAKKIIKIIQNQISNIDCWSGDSQEERMAMLEKLLAWFNDKENII